MAVEVAVTAQLHRMARQGPQDLRALIALVQRRVVEEAPDGPLSPAWSEVSSLPTSRFRTLTLWGFWSSSKNQPRVPQRAWSP